jgi:hypothetical protein
VPSLYRVCLFNPRSISIASADPCTTPLTAISAITLHPQNGHGDAASDFVASYPLQKVPIRGGEHASQFPRSGLLFLLLISRLLGPMPPAKPPPTRSVTVSRHTCFFQASLCQSCASDYRTDFTLSATTATPSPAVGRSLDGALSLMRKSDLDLSDAFRFTTPTSARRASTFVFCLAA